MNRILWIVVGFVLLSPCNAQQASSEYLRDAEAYIAAGEYKAAAIQLKNLLKDSPQNAEGRVMLGRTYVTLGDGASAIKELRRAKELGVVKEQWVVPLAQAYLLLGKPGELLDEIHPDSALSQSVQVSIYATLAMAQLAVNDLQEAEENLAKALKLDRESVEVLLVAARIAVAKKEFSAAGEFAQQALAIRENIADAWLILGEVQRVQENPEKAVEYFSKALAVNPNFLPAWLARATIYISRRDFDLAEKDLNQVREIAGDVPMALYLQGAVDFERKSYSEAKNRLLQVVNIVPDHLPSLLLLGTISYHQNQPETAYGYLSRYVQSVPDYLPAIKLLAATTIKNKQYQETVELLEAARMSAPDDPQLLALLGSAYIELGNYDKATEFLSKAAEFDPNAAAIRTQLALSYMGAGSLDQAVGELETAVDLGKGLGQADVMLLFALIRQKNFDAAIVKGLKLSGQLPENPVPDNLLAVAYLATGDEKSARKFWVKALEIQPSFVAAATNLAKLEKNNKNFAGAARRYQQVLEHRPGNINALLGLVDLARIQHKKDEMQKWLKIALKENPDNIQYRLTFANYLFSQGELQRAEEIVNTLKTNYPDDLQVLRQSGLIQLAAGKSKVAVSIFDRLVNEHPGNAELHFLLAQSLLSAGSNDKARAQWERALKLNPAYFSAAAALVQLSLNEKRYDEALKIARKIESKYPERAIGYHLEGDVLRARNDQKNALAAYKKSFSIEPNSILAQKVFLAARVLRQQSSAYQSMLNWLAKNPQDFSSRMLLGMAYIEDGEGDLAIQVYEQLIEKQPDNALALNNLAWLYQNTGDVRAVDLAERALALASDHPDIIDTVGWIFFLNGQLERSVALLQQAVQKAPDNKVIRYHFAEALVKIGRKSEAREELNSLLSGDAEFSERDKAKKLLKSI